MTHAARARSPFLFLRRFLEDPRAVGAVLPSSPSLGRVMVRGLAIAPGDLVVEYGPGTGALTESIAAFVARTPGCRYLGIERDPAFTDVLQRRFPSLEFVTDSVENVRAILQRRALPPPRVILSGLPLILLPTMRDIVTTAAAILQPGGVFRTFSYLQSWPLPNAFVLRRLFREQFADSQCSRLVLTNFPPAFVLHGSVA